MLNTILLYLIIVVAPIAVGLTIYVAIALLEDRAWENRKGGRW